jgi:hypothetical protein
MWDAIRKIFYVQKDMGWNILPKQTKQKDHANFGGKIL